MITLVNEGGNVGPGSEIHVKINGIDNGLLDAGKGSTLVINNVPFPADIGISITSSSGSTLEYTIEKEKACLNDLADFDVITQGTTIEVVNKWCPRCANVTKFVVRIEGIEKDLGVMEGDNVSFITAGCTAGIGVTAYMKNGEKRQIVYQDLDWCEYKEAERLQYPATMGPTPTPEGWCAREGERVFAYRAPDTCCKGLKVSIPTGSGCIPSPVRNCSGSPQIPGGVFICSK